MSNEELDINDYKKDLKGLCISCRKSQKCNDHLNTICVGKKLLWSLGKKVYKKRLKDGAK